MKITLNKNNIGFSSIYNNKIMLGALEKISDHSASFSITASMLGALVLRPLAVNSTTSVKKDNKKYLTANSISSGLAKFLLAEAVAFPVENAVKKLTSNRGADGVIEAAGGENSFETAWKIARPNAVVAIVAMYEKAQVLPLPDMYGKNLIFKTGGVDAVHCEKLVQLISEGKISTKFLISETLPFDDILKGYEIFETKRDNCLKIAVKGV